MKNVALNKPQKKILVYSVSEERRERIEEEKGKEGRSGWEGRGEGREK